MRIQNGCVFSSGWILFKLPFASCAFNIRRALSFEIPARAEISDNSFGLPCGIPDKTFSAFDGIFTFHLVDARQCSVVLRLFGVRKPIHGERNLFWVAQGGQFLNPARVSKRQVRLNGS